MTRVALYMRCSTEEQATEGLSIEGQRSVLLEYCRRKGLEVVEEYVDEGWSGRYAARPEFQRMIAAAKARHPPWDTILVIKWDRFARSTEDATAYKSVIRNKCGIDIIAVQQPSEDTATGRMVEGIMDVLAEFYSANLGEDTHRGMREKAKGGVGSLGRMPYGYRIAPDDTWAIDEGEAAIVRHIFERYVAGDGVYLIAEYLQTPEAQARFGDAVTRRRWSTSIVNLMLTNEAYIGTRHWGKSRVVRIDGTHRQRPQPESSHVTVDAAHPPIIARELWQVAQRIREARVGRAPRAAEDYLLRGLLRCGACGGPLHLSTGRHTYETLGGPATVVYRWMVCSRYGHGSGCSRQGIRYERLERLVLDEMLSAAADPRQLVFAPPAPSRGSERSRLEARLREIPLRIDRQLQAYEAGVISLDNLRLARERLLTEQASITELLASLNATAVDLVAFSARAAEALEIIASDADVAARRRAVASLISHISWDKATATLEIVWQQP